MRFTPIISTAALAGTVLALPSTPFDHAIEIHGLPKSDAPSTMYLAYQRDFFGDYTLQPSADKSNALLFDLMPNKTLKSSTGQAIGVEPFGYEGQTSSYLLYTNYTGTEGTYYKNKPHNLVMNSNANFSSWQVCESQYGLVMEYISSAYNKSVSAPTPGHPFSCYTVKLHARKTI